MRDYLKENWAFILGMIIGNMLVLWIEDILAK